jgi:predicted porin
MNKKLIALAVAGATVAPAAMAQTANPVTLYGRVHLTYEYVEAKGTPSQARRTRMQDQASLLGVRGTEDLGGGLKAFFQLETAFAPDQAPGTNGGFAGRNSGVGLQGGWGSLLMGRWDMPFKVVTGDLDPYGDVTIGGITAANNRGNDGTSFDRRDNNVVQYWSPNWAGFAIRLATQTSENKTASANPYNWGGSLTYNRGPFYGLFAYEEHKDQPAGGAEQKGYALGGRMKFGNFSFALMGQRYEQTGRTDMDSIFANVVWRAGNHELIYQYQQSEEGGPNGAATQPECKVHQPGYHYYFSRRTRASVQYAKTDNNAAGTCGANMSPGAVAAGQDPQGFSVGMRHTF